MLQILVATWCENERDLEIVWKMLTQLTAAYQPLGGRCVVILSAREKLDMEALFRRVCGPFQTLHHECSVCSRTLLLVIEPGTRH